jgi:hypothetical protein
MVYSNNFNQVRVGIRNGVVTQVVNAVDADATAFIAAAGITNLTQAAAISTLVNDLKTYGLWTKMKALYPFVGGSAASHKFNLKDPRDLDAAYRLVFSGGWTHTSTGALPNGTTGYADTKLNPTLSCTLNNTHLSFYSRTNIASNLGQWDISANDGDFAPTLSLTSGYQGVAYSDQYSYVHGSNGRTSFANTNTTGFYISSRTSNTSLKFFRNDVVRSTSTTLHSGTMPNRSIYIGRNTAGAIAYSSKESAFASIGDGLTDTDASNFYTAIQKFNSTLGRQVGTPVVSDSDATAFISAAGITNNEQANAVNTLVTDLKTAGIWTKMKAIYPFVGGTATSHKFNLKDPRDVDAAFRLQFNGGWTHGPSGALSNGTTGYANTYFTPSIAYSSATDVGATIYQNVPGISGEGCYVSSNSLFLYGAQQSGDIDVRLASDFATPFVLSYTNDGKGLFTTTKNGSTAVNVYKNGSKVGSVSKGSGLPNISSYIGARNGNGTANEFSTITQKFVAYHNGLTDSESSSLYTAVQKFQTALGRQIGTPVLPDGQIAKLLDSYTGAAAAYSLRKLRTAYSGYAIRVRRSSDNLEQDITFDTNGVLDTTSLLAFVGNGNGFVTTWYDQSGNARDAVQASSSWQPQIIISGVLNTYNSKVCVKFDGVDDYIQSPYTSGTTNELYFVTQTTDTQFLFPRGVNNYGFVATQGNTSTNLSLYNSTQPQLFVNSVLRNPINRGDIYNLLVGYKLSLHKNANISNGFNYLRFGSFIQDGSLDFNGNLFEWIIYPTLQSSQTSIESNINSYYSIY